MNLVHHVVVTRLNQRAGHDDGVTQSLARVQFARAARVRRSSSHTSGAWVAHERGEARRQRCVVETFGERASAILFDGPFDDVRFGRRSLTTCGN